MSIVKEIWTDQVMENFYPDTSFLMYVKDFSADVNNNIIHLTEAGVDPEVLTNNTTYPIEIVGTRADTDLPIQLDKFETKNTVVRRPDVIQLNYNQLDSVLMGHRNTLRTTTGIKAAHAYCPNSDSSFTPVFGTTGETSEGVKRMTITDVLKMKRMYDNLDIPLDKRFLILHPNHLEDLILEDTKTFKDIVDIKNGVLNRFAGFNVLQFTKNPRYNSDTLAKVALNAAPSSTDTFCSFTFYGDEVMKADGDIYMYLREDDPEQRGAIVGFDKRFIALPIRNKGIGAIVAKKV